MNVLKLIAVVTLISGSVAVVSGTGAFTAIDANRMADVGVANDENALLGVTPGGGAIDPGEKVTLFTVENQFGEPLDSVAVTVVDSGPFNNVILQETPGSLAAGESGGIAATIAGPPGASGMIEVEIAASGDSGTVELTREVYVEIESRGRCTIGNDDRIGDREFFAEDAFFDCTIVIDTDRAYEVGFENSTATGGFELSAPLLQELAFEDSEIGGATDIAVSKNANGDVSFEATSFRDGLSIDIGQVAQGITLEDSAVEGEFDVSSRNQNGDVSIESSEIDGGVGMTFDGPVSGDIETEDSQVGGSYEIDARDNLNGDVTVEEAAIGGDLVIAVDGNANGDITIESVDVSGDLTVVVDGRLNGDIGISGNAVGGDLTVEADTKRGGGSVELEDNTVGGTVTRP